MPNHIHGIILITHKINVGKNDFFNGWCDGGIRGNGDIGGFGGRDEALPRLYHQNPGTMESQIRPDIPPNPGTMESQTRPDTPQNVGLPESMVYQNNHRNPGSPVFQANINPIKNQQSKKIQMSRISPKPGTLPVIIGSYKSIVTRTVRQQYYTSEFAWQERYYDHIIRNDQILNHIRRYIKFNPLKWQSDRNNFTSKINPSYKPSR